MKEEPPPTHLCTESIGVFEDILQRGLSLSLRATGKSMTPFLRGTEILTIKKVPSATLSIGDLIFFKTLDEVPVIHRIVKKQRERNGVIFLTKGDSLLGFDAPIGEGHILGKVYGVHRDGRNGNAEEIDMESCPQRFLNYITAVFSLAKTRIYAAAVKVLPPFVRLAIKKVFLQAYTLRLV
jgi:signal peptidase I